ncbi:MAG TPA: hypothetical protein P5083_01105 [Candidatus Paceibacterota bacterium]|nr:hypothetical protein [Candidatus Paceibacterota bacterium]
MDKKFKVVLWVLIALLVILLIVVLIMINKDNTKKDYSIIYLDTGEIYIGVLKRFPFTQLTDVYTLQSDQTGQLAVVPMSSTIWAPITPLRLNPDRIVFSAKISQNSQVYQIITNPTSQSQTTGQIQNQEQISPVPSITPNEQ